MNHKKKKILLGFCLIAGLLLQFTGICLGPGQLRIISGICIGAGAMLFSVSVNKLYRVSYEKEFPGEVRKEQIELSDERNVQIRNLAKAKTSDISRWVVIGLAWANFLVRGSLWTTFILIGIFALIYILEWHYAEKYRREM